MVTELELLQFFKTQPHKCSYLPNQMAVTVFLNSEQVIDKTLYTKLSEFGFRRSGQHVYKPMCADCNACIPVRIPTAKFKPNRQQKRTWKLNQDLVIHQVKTIDTDEHYQIYENYICKRHADGDMFPPSRDQFRNFLTSEWRSTRLFELRDGDRLIATSVADVLDNGISAVYTYYDPSESWRSLGNYVILYLIEKARQLQLSNVYLGYWIKSSPKMSYKSTFRPLEIFNGEYWLPLS